MDRNTGFAQYGLRNAGQLVRIGPSLGMAEFGVNSAISTGDHVRRFQRIQLASASFVPKGEWTPKRRQELAVGCGHRVTIPKISCNPCPVWDLR